MTRSQAASEKMAPGTQLTYGNNDCKIFVGAIPKDADDEQIRDAFEKWDGVVGVFCGQTGHVYRWATVEFTCQRRRDDFLKERHKHRFQNHVLDVKKFTKNPPQKGGNPTNNSPPSTFNAAAAASAAAATNNARPATVRPPLSRPQQPQNQTAIIKNWVSREFGVLRAADPNLGNGIFHVSAVWLCGEHGLSCRMPGCPRYKSGDGQHHPLWKMPINTQVSVRFRLIKDFKGYLFQATAVWPQLSLVPPIPQPQPPHSLGSNEEELLQLDIQLIQFSELDASDGATAVMSSLAQLAKADGGGNNNANSSSSNNNNNPAGDTMDKTSIISSDSKTSVTASNTTTNDEDDEATMDFYLEYLGKIKDFFSAQIAGPYDSRSAKELGLLKVSRSVMDLKGRNNEVIDQGIIIIDNFIADKDIRVPEEKKAAIMSYFKVLMHNIFHSMEENRYDAERASALLKKKAANKDQKPPASAASAAAAVLSDADFEPTGSNGSVIIGVSYYSTY